MPTVDGNLLSPGAFNNGRCSPSGDIFSRCAPELFAVRKIEGGQKGVGEHIAQHNDLAIVDDWGTGKTPLGAGDHKETSFQGTEIFFPNEFSGVIKTEKPFGSE